MAEKTEAPVTKPAKTTVDQVVEQCVEDPSFFAQFISKMRESETFGKMYHKNKDAALLATKARVGSLVADRVREGMIRNMLPEQHQAVLDNKFVASAVDWVMGNMAMLVVEMYGHKLPEKMQPYADAFAESLVYHAYHGMFSKIDFEGMLTKVLSGDIMGELGELIAAKQKQ